MAGLNFPDNAVYQKEKKGMFNPASFELIPWILGRCSSVEEAEALLKNTNITGDAFSLAMPPAPLHWMLADRCRCLVLEPVGTGLNILENPIGVLTNNPPFEYHRWNLSQYMNLQAAPAVNRFAGGLKLKPCSQGVGAAGLPGDASSVSRLCGSFSEVEFRQRQSGKGKCFSVFPYSGCSVHGARLRINTAGNLGCYRIFLLHKRRQRGLLL